MSDVIQFLRGSKTAPRLSSGCANLSYPNIKLSDLYNGTQSGVGLVSNVDIALASKTVQRSLAMELPQGWSNQDLSDLYRAHRLLALAGIATEIDRGLTDEGDPWFVFMDSRNEVFVHFSRYDGAYMLSCQVHDKPVWGASLAELVVRFSELLQLVNKNNPDRQNVVSIARHSQDTVFVHPVAALAALVWSIYLMSDDLAAATPPMMAEFEGNASQADLPSPTPYIVVLPDLPDLAQKSMAAVISAVLAKHNAVAHHDREANLGMNVSNMSSNQSMKTMGLGLSLAALSVGLPLFNAISKEAPLDAAEPSEKAAHSASVEDIKTAVLLAEASLKVFQQNHAKHHNATSGTNLIDEPAANIQIDAVSIDVHDITNSISVTYTAGPDQLSYPQKKIAPTMHQVEPVSDGMLSTGADAVKSIQDIDALIDTSIVQRFGEAFGSTVLTSIDRLTVSEFTQLVTINRTTELIELLDEPIQPTQYAVFDDQAREYLDLLLQTYEDIRIVALLNEIIFINVDAFDTASIEDPIYTRSWSFDDGGTISTVGLKSDMEMLDGIA